MDHAEERARVVDVAGSWVGTPYRSGQGVKGGGVDCGYFLLRVYQEAGLIDITDDDLPMPPRYKGQLARFRAGEQFYRGIVAMFGVQVDRDPLPGDIVLFDVFFGDSRGKGTLRSTHGAIVGEWPMVFHASLGDRHVILQDVSAVNHYPLNSVWTFRGWA